MPLYNFGIDIGPPIVNPNWFFCNCRLGVPALFALNPLAPYRWSWRGTGLGGTEPVTWRRRLRRAGFAPEAVSQGLGPRWNPQADGTLQSGAGIRAAYLLRAERRAAALTPIRPGHRQPLRTLAAPA